MERWFFKRQRVLKEALLKKAKEVCWRCFVYFVLFVYGCFTLLPTDWFYDSRKWVKGLIREQPFTSDLKWYYRLEMAFYASLFFSQFVDHKRKDFWEVFVHHIATLIPLFGSFMNGHFRVGVVIMFIHDSSDYWLESARVTNYMKLEIAKVRVCDVLFFIFAVTFFLTRWLYYPFVVLHYALYTSTECGVSISHIVINVLLFVLQFLHIFWGFQVGKLAYSFLVTHPDKDPNSEDEDEDEWSDGEPQHEHENGDLGKKDQ